MPNETQSKANIVIFFSLTPPIPIPLKSKGWAQLFSKQKMVLNKFLPSKNYAGYQSQMVHTMYNQA